MIHMQHLDRAIMPNVLLGIGAAKVIPNPRDFVVKKCCDNCDYFAESEMEFAEGYCMKNVANTLCGQYLEDTYTFYCSYHKFKV